MGRKKVTKKFQMQPEVLKMSIHFRSLTRILEETKRWNSKGVVRVWGKRDVNQKEEEKRAWQKNSFRVWGKRDGGEDVENLSTDKRPWKNNKLKIWGKRSVEDDNDEDVAKRAWNKNRIMVWGKRDFKPPRSWRQTRVTAWGKRDMGRWFCVLGKLKGNGTKRWGLGENGAIMSWSVSNKGTLPMRQPIARKKSICCKLCPLTIALPWEPSRPFSRRSGSWKWSLSGTEGNEDLGIPIRGVGLGSYPLSMVPNGAGETMWSGFGARGEIRLDLLRMNYISIHTLTVQY